MATCFFFCLGGLILSHFFCVTPFFLFSFSFFSFFLFFFSFFNIKEIEFWIHHYFLFLNKIPIFINFKSDPKLESRDRLFYSKYNNYDTPRNIL
jgi:hypothetical protein